MQKSKEKTSRITLWRDLKIPNVFTMEASFCGSEKLACHFTCDQYMEIGKQLCRGIIYYFDLKKETQILNLANNSSLSLKRNSVAKSPLTTGKLLAGKKQAWVYA